MASTPLFSPQMSILETGEKAVESWNSVGQQWLRGTWLLGWSHGHRATPFSSTSECQGLARAPQGVSVWESCKCWVSFTSTAKSPLHSPLLFRAEALQALCSNSSPAPHPESGGIIHPSLGTTAQTHLFRGRDQPILFDLQEISHCMVAPAQPRALHFSFPSQFLVVMSPTWNKVRDSIFLSM